MLGGLRKIIKNKVYIQLLSLGIFGKF